MAKNTSALMALLIEQLELQSKIGPLELLVASTEIRMELSAHEKHKHGGFFDPSGVLKLVADHRETLAKLHKQFKENGVEIARLLAEDQAAEAA